MKITFHPSSPKCTITGLITKGYFKKKEKEKGKKEGSDKETKRNIAKKKNRKERHVKQ